MNRFVLGLFGLAVVVGLAVYLLGDHDAPPAPPPPATGSGSGVAIVRDHVHGPRPKLPATVTPAAPVASAGSADAYTIGGVQVRDHRGGNTPHMDIPPAIHPPDMHQISSKIVQDVAQQVRSVMKQCTADLPAGARAGSSRLQGQVVVAIKDHQLTVTGATMQLRDVSGDAVDATRQCIEQQSIGLHAGAAGEPDVEHYAISVNFALM